MIDVSVIIPTFNYGQFIATTIESVLGQTYKDFEIIVVDDGSSDNTEQLIKKKYGRNVKYLYQENRGAPAARNRGIKKAQGKYLVFLDADDWFHDSNLKKKKTLLDSKPEFGWVYSDCQYVLEDGLELKKKITFKGFCSEKKLEGFILKDLIMGNLIPLNSVMIRREILDEVGMFDEKLKSLQDYDLFLRIAPQHKIGYIDEKLIYVFCHKNSISNMTERQTAYNSKIRVVSKVAENNPDVVKELGWHWKKILADKYNYLMTKSLEEKEMVEAFNYMKKSIICYPVQKEVFVSFFRYYVDNFKTRQC